jgi:hypothetical protein
MNSKTGNKENPMLGNIFFGLQCFFGSMFFLLQKSVLDRYPPLQTTAWGASHILCHGSDDASAVPLRCASTRGLGYCMGGILMVLVVTPQATEASDWDIDRNELLAILYVIFISSALGYALYACERELVPGQHYCACRLAYHALPARNRTLSNQQRAVCALRTLYCSHFQTHVCGVTRMFRGE